MDAFRQLLDALGSCRKVALALSEMKWRTRRHPVLTPVPVVVGGPPVARASALPLPGPHSREAPSTLPLPDFLAASSCYLTESTSHIWKEKERRLDFSPIGAYKQREL